MTEDFGTVFYEVISGSRAYGFANENSDIDFRGVSPLTLQENFGNRKISEIPQIVAEEIEKVFGVKIKPKDVQYVEESCNG